jgi:hypothetical protein
MISAVEADVATIVIVIATDMHVMIRTMSRDEGAPAALAIAIVTVTVIVIVIVTFVTAESEIEIESVTAIVIITGESETGSTIRAVHLHRITVITIQDTPLMIRTVVMVRPLHVATMTAVVILTTTTLQPHIRPLRILAMSLRVAVRSILLLPEIHMLILTIQTIVVDHGNQIRMRSTAEVAQLLPGIMAGHHPLLLLLRHRRRRDIRLHLRRLQQVLAPAGTIVMTITVVVGVQLLHLIHILLVLEGTTTGLCHEFLVDRIFHFFA